MHSTLVKLPRSPKKKVAHRHGNHITLNGVFIGANLESNIHRVLDFKSAGVSKPLNMIRMGVLLVCQLELVTKFFASKVVSTSTINDDLD